METTSNERLKKLVSLLELEREEDYRLYREQFYKASFAERRKNGLTWYPVELRGEEPAYVDYIQVNLERATHLNESHQFAGGKNVVFFSNKNNELKEIKGTIKHVQKNTMAVILRTDELPDWAYEGKLGVNLQFDEQSYEQMNIAMEKVISDNVGRLAELKQIFEKTEETA